MRSSARTRFGLGVDDYQAPYWTKRGRVRFYRYVLAIPVRETAAGKLLFERTKEH